MKFSFAHNNINVKDLDRSLSFYKDALGLEEVGHIDGEDGSFKIVYLGDNEFHVAFYVDDYAGALAKHKAMNCVVYENEAMGIYFIADPDGYWTEIIPAGAY